PPVPDAPGAAGSGPVVAGEGRPGRRGAGHVPGSVAAVRPVPRRGATGTDRLAPANPGRLPGDARPPVPGDTGPRRPAGTLAGGRPRPLVPAPRARARRPGEHPQPTGQPARTGPPPGRRPRTAAPRLPRGDHPPRPGGADVPGGRRPDGADAGERRAAVVP